MNKKGFTLTELITVIAIIGLILLITIPVYTGVMNNNKEEKYKLYVETVEKAVLTYADIEADDGDKSVTIQTLIDNGYLKDSSDGITPSDPPNTSINFTKSGTEVIITGVIEIEFKDGTTCNKTECW